MAEHATSLSVVEAAAQLGIDPAKVYELVFRRQLGFTTTTSGRIRIPSTAVDEFLTRTRTPSA